MSGVAEAIAIASCVAALISAYKDGGTILSKIKRRRQTQGALPPTVHLEKSLEKGENAIVEALVEGREHFGPGYEFGDDEAVRALQVITIETQAALLSRLAAATEDDNITDFSACIAASDKGRLEALIVLNQLFLRKQAQAAQLGHITMQGLNNSTSNWGLPSSSTPPGTSPNAAPYPSSLSEQVARQEEVFPNGRRSKSIPWPFRSRRSSNKTNSSMRSSESLGAQQHGSNNHSRSTSAGMSSSPPTPQSGHTIPVSPSSRISAESVEAQSAAPGLGIHPAATFSTIASRESRSSSLQVPSISPIADRSTFCKYSYYLRAGLKEDGLRFYDQSITGQKNYRFKCKSTSCAFQCVARKPAESQKWLIDERVRVCHGIEFRWLFLAKSHVPRTSTLSDPKFRCLVCVLGGDSSSLFEGHGQLLQHVLGHQGAHLGATMLEGAISFGNEGVKPTDDVSFDIKFPLVATTVVQDHQFPRTNTSEITNATTYEDEKRATHWSDEMVDPWADAT